MSERTFRSLVRYDGGSADSWCNYHCGHCGHEVTGLVVARHHDPDRIQTATWLLCPNCGDASVITKKNEQ